MVGYPSAHYHPIKDYSTHSKDFASSRAAIYEINRIDEKDPLKKEAQIVYNGITIKDWQGVSIVGARKERLKSSQIASINTDYVRAVVRKEQRQKAHRVRLYRRLAVFGILVVLTAIGIGSMMISQAKTLAAIKVEKAEALERLEGVQEEQDMLKHQIIKLNDDEYIAKLARKEYYLSENGEIIFAIPEDQGKGKKNEDGKE